MLYTYRYTHKLFSEQGDKVALFPHLECSHCVLTPNVPPQSHEMAPLFPSSLIRKAATCSLAANSMSELVTCHPSLQTLQSWIIMAFPSAETLIWVSLAH